MKTKKKLIKIGVFTISEKIKDILVNLAVEDKLPMDMTLLNADIFNEILTPIVSTLITLHEDATMALNDEWDRSDDGFVDQKELIEEILPMLNKD